MAGGVHILVVGLCVLGGMTAAALLAGAALWGVLYLTFECGRPQPASTDTHGDCSAIPNVAAPADFEIPRHGGFLPLEAKRNHG